MLIVTLLEDARSRMPARTFGEGILSSVERTVISSVERTVISSVERTVISSVERTVISSVERTVISSVERTVISSVERTVISSRAISTFQAFGKQLHTYNSLAYCEIVDKSQDNYQSFT